MDVIVTWLVEEDFEVTDDGICSLPSLAHSSWLGDLDPPLACCAHTVVHVYAEWELSWGGGGR